MIKFYGLDHSSVLSHLSIIIALAYHNNCITVQYFHAVYALCIYLFLYKVRYGGKFLLYWLTVYL